jgi:EAL domain-containing protein (putative c-di-GMP-specific phosphodiesterase class I)
LLSPGDFIALAEDTGSIIPIGLWVLREACRQMQAWQQQPRHGDPLVVAVNLSARQFRHATLLEDIATILKETGLDPQFLKLEITESVVLDSVDSTLSTLRALKALGVQLAIDDFGTGYSSLNYLKQFPIDVIKIDRSFIQGLGETAQDTAMIAAMITLGHALGFQVLTEGVETNDQLTRLDTLQCDLAQGYLFARPLPAEAVAEYLAHHSQQPVPGP